MEPMLRFKADDGSEFSAWEEKTLGEVFIEIKEKNRSELPVLSVQQGVGTVLRDSSERRIAYNKNSLNNYKVMRKGDFIIHLRSFEGGLECSNHDGISSPAYRILRSNGILSDAFKDYFRSYTFIKGKLSDSVVGIRDGKNIDMLTFWEIQISVPSLPEQRKIADLLSAVDDAVTTQKAEVAAWEKRKKGVMQKLFSQEIRFKADDGSDFQDWKEKKLGDLGYFIRGLSYNKTQILDDGSDASGTAVLRSNNINSDGTLDYRDDVQLVLKEPSSEQQLRENDIVICMANGSNRLVGKAARYDGGYDARRITVGAFCGIFRTDSPLMSWWFQSDGYKSFLHLSKQGGDGALANLKGKDIEAISLLFPSSSTEQHKIADCLASLDDVIAKAKDELDAWCELKKGLLQQMFV